MRFDCQARPLNVRARGETARLAGRAAALVLAGALVSLSGCVTVNQDAPMPQEIGAQGIVIERSLPKSLPEDSKAIPGSQLVLVPTESAAGLFVPLPFVSEVVTDVYHRYEASTLATHYAAIDLYGTVQRALDGSVLLKGGAGSNPLYPIGYVVACADGRYRVALAGRIEQGKWTGRYVVHLPTTYSEDEVAKATPATLSAMRREFGDAALIMRQLLERDAAGALPESRTRADVGSLHLACAKAAGLLKPELVLARGAEVLEDGADHVIVRVAGDLRQSGPSGGLLYGVHYLRKDQLHTFKRKP